MKNLSTKVLLSALALGLWLAGGCATTGTGRFAKLDQQQFYDAEGKFDSEAAKRVYLDYLEQAGYPLTETIAAKIFVSDFGLGRFTEVGLGGILWWGDERHNYSGLDAFLLPGQIIPEHWHVRVGTIPEKMESWLVRHGEIYAYAEGPATPNPKATLASADAAHVTARNERVLRVGDIVGLSRPLEKHWMQAGPQGAIFTEFCTYHTGEAVRFTDSNIKF
ncbi:MAG: hypothetical protein FJ387_22590 [Verrucomicrobia bacterium]|nr:hypothetical protein [Verrucomicrobiota bacterium]